MLNENEFFTIAIQDKDAIKKMCRDITIRSGHASAFRYLMDLRRDIQKALARYSKKKTNLDGIQLNAVKITRWLEIWCGEWFRMEARKEIAKKNPLKEISPKQLQRLAENEWEKYILKESY